ncbi:hypothetical protein V2J09_011386 [Rumex salicifolius]
MPQAKLGFQSPYHVLYKKKPTVTQIRVFGCVCYVFIPDQMRKRRPSDAYLWELINKGKAGGALIRQPTKPMSHVTYSLMKVRLGGVIIMKCSRGRTGRAIGRTISGVTRSPGKETISSGGSCSSRDDEAPSRTSQLGSVIDDESGARRSTRIRKPNPRYVDVGFAKVMFLQQRYDLIITGYALEEV